MYRTQLKRGLVLIVLAAMTVSSVLASNLPLPSAEATSTITVRDMKKHLSFLASDELGGRYTLSPSNRIAARYLASQLESFGYRGAARDGSYFQKVPLVTGKVDEAGSKLILDLGGKRHEFKFGDDFISRSSESFKTSGELVFLGYGVSSAKNEYDDYAGVNVKGKIVVIVPGFPEALKGKKLDPSERGLRAAEAHGAAGIISVAPPQYLMGWEHLKGYFTREQIGIKPTASDSGRELPYIMAGPSVVKALASALGKESGDLTSAGSRELKPAAISGTASIEVRMESKDAAPAQNVVGILEGSDPKLKDEYVVLSAHYDHLKTRDDGTVYHGADDDGSGTVAVLEIARAFAEGARPKRSVLVVFHTGEELGLFGSEYNTDFEPVVPLKKLVVDLNIDMIGRSRPEGDTDTRDQKLTDRNSVYLIGADKLSTELNRISEETNKETAGLKLDYTYNDEKSPERFYYRSDHYNYAKHGIPVIFYFTGVHRDYHQPTDDVSKIDFEKMEKITRMIFATGWRIANLDHRLAVDRTPAADAGDN